MEKAFKLSKWFMFSSALVLCLMTGTKASAQAQTNKLRIGVYDSRAVAAAYANSTEFQETLKAVRGDDAAGTFALFKTLIADLAAASDLPQQDARCWCV